MSSKQKANHEFQRTGQEPGIWLGEALQLKRAAELVLAELNGVLSVYPHGRASYEDLSLFKAYMLLSGIAIENLVKGILVCRDPSIVGNDKVDKVKWKGSSHGHDLAELAKQTGIPFTLEEKGLFRRLSAFVVWGGRYPIPIKSSDMVQRTKYRGQSIRLNTFISSDPDLIRKVFEKASTILETERLSTLSP